MGNFGAAVTSLLDTYTKCLSLLKGTRKNDEGALSDTHSTLSASLRSDRARVRRVYASRLSKDGSRFEKGDAPARSALKRIVKKLTTTLTDIVCSSRDGKRQPVRYDSLVALSNGSSIEAIRTMNDLSSRVGSRSTISQGSVVSRGRQRSHRHDQKARNRSKKHSEGRSKSHTKERKESSSRQQRSPVDRHRQRSSKGRHSPDKSTPHQRVSILTISSDSTKLGEIRRRLSKQTPVEDYENMAAYPLYSYHNEAVQARKRWWNPFRRSRPTDADF